MQNNEIPQQIQSPRARVILEFIEGDVSKPPIAYPCGGDDEIDSAMVEAILARWRV